MGNDPQPPAGRPQDEVLLEPEKFLAELGWSPSGRKSPAPAVPPVGVAERLYCSYCWCVLPADATLCDECGSSVAEMEAAQAARAQEDSNWVPPRMWRGGAEQPAAAARGGRLFQPVERPTARGPVPPAPSSTRFAPAPPASSAVVISWKHVVMAVGIGGFVGGATVAALWVLLQTFGRPAGASTPLFSTPPPATALAPARLSWRSPVAELRLQLVSASGVVVADSLEPAAGVALEPGEYRLRVTDNTGRWAPSEERVIVAPGEAFVAGPSPRVIAGYYLWAGKKLYEEGKLERAERVWSKAVQAYPEGTDARLQLAALLAVRYRYAEARIQLQEVLRREPTSTDALRLLATLDELEGKR